MELPNESASFVVIFALFCFVFIWDESVTSVLAKNAGKAIVYVTNDKLYSYDIIQGIEQAISISCFSFCGVSKWESKENAFCTFG